jgi:hypothetical protein
VSGRRGLKAGDLERDGVLEGSRLGHLDRKIGLPADEVLRTSFLVEIHQVFGVKDSPLQVGMMSLKPNLASWNQSGHCQARSDWRVLWKARRELRVRHR